MGLFFASENVDWTTFRNTSSSASITLPNDSETLGWRIQFISRCSSSSNAGVINISGVIRSDYARHSFVASSDSVTSDKTEVIANSTTISFYRGADTGFDGDAFFEMTLFKNKNDDKKLSFVGQSSYNSDTSETYTSRVAGRIQVSSSMNITLTFSKGTLTSTFWRVEQIK